MVEGRTPMSSVLVVRSLGCKTGSIVGSGRERGRSELTSMRWGLDEGEALAVKRCVRRVVRGVGGVWMSLKANGEAREKRDERK